MARRAKPTKAKVEAKPPARNSRKREGFKVRDLEKRLAEALKREAEAQEQQTATSEVLKVISQSPEELAPAFSAILVSAIRLCEAQLGGLFLFDEELWRGVAFEGAVPKAIEHFRSPFPAGPLTALGRTVATRRPVHIPDILEDPAYHQGDPVRLATVELLRARTYLVVPILREETLVGAIVIYRHEVRSFSDRHISLLQTFADQAVIAIENVRLFNETKDALERQTATSEILNVINQSPTDVLPVFDTIVKSAMRLCNAVQSNLQLFDGELMHWGAQQGIGREAMDSIRRIYPMRPDQSMTASRSVLTRSVVHVPDVLDDPEYLRELAVKGGFRSVLSVPMMGKGRPIGAITVGRMEAGLFSETEITLLQTFADQAVIAIENVRLFKELEARNRDLTATSEILQVISRSPTDVQPVFETIVDNAHRLFRSVGTVVLRYDGDFLSPAALRVSAETREWVPRLFPMRPSPDSAVGRCVLTRAAVHVADYEASDAPAGVRDVAKAGGWRSALAVPMFRDEQIIGAIFVSRATPGAFADREIALLKTFADQAVIAVENVRLFKELEVANRELAAASQHKSEFLANMSHELRTPLNAIIGFSEVLSEKMFGELNEKQEEYLKDIYASGTHLLSLINDILDLSKIEAGRMELELTDFDLPTAIENALMLVRERAGRRNLTLHKSVDAGVGQLRADERKIRQVVLNLLSNAIKFTPEGGRIEVGAVPRDGFVEVSVSDTGVGIAPEDQERVFEEFRQVGTADKNAEGTGLGLTLCRKFVEGHGGRIWVKSRVGQGSVFTFTIPVIE